MWFAARDIAFEDPVTEDMTQTMLVRMGIVAPDGKPPTPAEAQAAARGAAPVPRSRPLARDDAAAHGRAALHRGLRRSTRSRGPKRCSSDTDLVAGDGAAADLVRYVRADETPHVDYLRTALTEMRDRTFVGESGRQHPGHRSDRHAVGRRARAVARARTARTSYAPRWPRSSTRSPAIRAGPRSSKASTRSARCQSRESRHEVRHLLRAPAPAAVGRPTPSTG